MVNQPGDVYEQEADQVAEQVMRMTEPQLQRTCACGGKSEEGECEACKLSRKAHGEVAGGAHVPGIVHEVLRSPGRPLDEATRTSMDARFHFDFSRVRIHDDAHAAESASAVSALAYTVGRDVVFRAGQYSPATAAGRRLLAHELTHVVQQHASGSTAAQPFTIGPAHGPAEREADAIAEAMAASEPLAPISGTSGTRLQRSAISDDERFLHLGTCMEMACCDAFACQDDKGGIACPDDLECPGDSKNKPFSVFKHKFSRHLSCDPECDKGIVSCSDKDKVLALPKTGDHKFERKKCNQTLTICANGKSTTATVREASETEKSWEASPGVIDALGVGEENFHASVYPKPNDPDMKDDPKCTPKSKPKPKPSKAKPE